MIHGASHVAAPRAAAKQDDVLPRSHGGFNNEEDSFLLPNCDPLQTELLSDHEFYNAHNGLEGDASDDAVYTHTPPHDRERDTERISVFFDEGGALRVFSPEKNRASSSEAGQQDENITQHHRHTVRDPSYQAELKASRPPTNPLVIFAPFILDLYLFISLSYLYFFLRWQVYHHDLTEGSAPANGLDPSTRWQAAHHDLAEGSAPAHDPDDITPCKACAQRTHTPHTCGKARSSISQRSRTPKSPQLGRPPTTPASVRAATSLTPPTRKKADRAGAAATRAPRPAPSAALSEAACITAVTVSLPAPAHPLVDHLHPTPRTAPLINSKCTFEKCLNPYHTSGSWKMVTEETRAGGRDW